MRLTVINCREAVICLRYEQCHKTWCTRKLIDVLHLNCVRLNSLMDLFVVQLQVVILDCGHVLYSTSLAVWSGCSDLYSFYASVSTGPH